MREKCTKESRTFRNNFCNSESLNLPIIHLLLTDRRKISFIQIFQNYDVMEEFENWNRIQRKKKLWDVTNLVLCSKKIIFS